MVQSKKERKAYLKDYYSRPEIKAHRKKLAKKYNARLEIKAHRKKYSAKPENVMKRKDYANSPKGKATAKAFNRTPQRKAQWKKFRDKLENKAKRVNRTLKLKFEVFSVYSKRHSNSDIPCCRCCKDSSHIEFLAVDHIHGRKHLPKEEQTLGGRDMNNWLKKNNYPEGFQILCSNCNFAKAMYGKCPHEL